MLNIRLLMAFVEFISEYPNVKVTIVDAYSTILTERVAGGLLDFAIVPRAPRKNGIRTRPARK
jgi:LysR family transcriptional regulator, nitrogen assimilation regulatory protein